jgi:hypothetical protein
VPLPIKGSKMTLALVDEIIRLIRSTGSHGKAWTGPRIALSWGFDMDRCFEHGISDKIPVNSIEERGLSWRLQRTTS